MNDKSVWVLIPTEDVPERWASRSRSMSLVPLAPDEADSLLEEGTTAPELSREEERVARLAAQGRTPHEIARELHLTDRSVYRRIARLRDELGVETRSELIAELVRRGF